MRSMFGVASQSLAQLIASQRCWSVITRSTLGLVGWSLTGRSLGALELVAERFDVRGEHLGHPASGVVVVVLAVVTMTRRVRTGELRERLQPEPLPHHVGVSGEVLGPADEVDTAR